MSVTLQCPPVPMERAEHLIATLWRYLEEQNVAAPKLFVRTVKSDLVMIAMRFPATVDYRRIVSVLEPIAGPFAEHFRRSKTEGVWNVQPAARSGRSPAVEGRNGSNVDALGCAPGESHIDNGSTVTALDRSTHARGRSRTHRTRS